MVELPTGRSRLVTTEAPQDRTPGREMAAMAASIGQGLRDVGSGLEDVAVPLAERKGREDAARAIQLDENGKIQIATPDTSFILGRAGAAYADAKQAELLIAGRTQVDADLQDIRRKYEGDPEGFQKEAGAYLTGRRNANVAGIGQQTFDYGLRNMQQHYGNMVDQKATRDFTQTTQVFSGRMAQLQGQEDSLLMQGISSGPEWDRIQSEKAEIRDNMQRNPRFNYDQRLRTLDEGADQQRRAGLAVAYEGRGRIRAGDPPDVVVRDIEERLSKMGMSQEQVQKFVGIARQNVAGMSAARSANRQKAEADADLAIASLKGGETLDDGQVADIIGRLAANGGERKAADLMAQRRIHEEIRPIIEDPNSTAEERTWAMGELKALREGGVTVPGVRAARSGPGMPALRQELSANEVGLLNAIAGPESRGLYNIRYTGSGGITFNGYQDHPRLRERIATGANAGKTSDAAGRYQFLSSTWDSLPAEAKGDGTFSPANQDRAALWLAKRDYQARTGRDLMADIDANGMTPQILQALSGTWEGFQSEAGRRNAIAAFNGASAGESVKLPVRATVVSAVQKDFDEYIKPVAARIAAAYERDVPPTEQDLRDYEEMLPYTTLSEQKGAIANLEIARRTSELRRSFKPFDNASLRGFVEDFTKREKEGGLTPQEVEQLRAAESVAGSREDAGAGEYKRLSDKITAAFNAGDIPAQEDIAAWKKLHPLMRKKAGEDATRSVIDAEEQFRTRKQIDTLSNADLARWNAAQQEAETNGQLSPEGVRIAKALRAVVDEREKAGKAEFNRLAQNAIKALTEGKMPATDEAARIRDLLPLMRDEGAKDTIRRLEEAEKKFQIAAQPQNWQPIINAVDDAERAGSAKAIDRLVGEAARAAAEEQDRLRTEDPLELGRRRAAKDNMLDIYGRRGTIDWSNPTSMMMELTLRRQQSDWTRNIDRGAGAMPLYADDRKSLAQALPSLDGNQARNVLATLQTTFTREQMSALMGDKDVRGAIVSLTRSADPAKLNAGFAFLDARWRENPVEFESTFGGDQMKRMTRWQTYLGAVPEDKIAERMMRAEEPRTIAARKTLEEYAQSELDKVGSPEVMAKMHREMSPVLSRIPFNNLSAPNAGSPLVPSATQMLEDYKSAYKMEYVDNGGDPAAAEKFALSVVQKNWGVSTTTGRVMRHPPENSPKVPKMAGSHDWVREQFHNDALQLLGVDRARLTPFIQKWYTPPDAGRGLIPDKVAGTLTAKEQQALAILRGDFELGADGQTEADMLAGRAPSYRIVVKTEDGKMVPLQKAPMDFYRWSPDAGRVNRDWIKRDQTYRAVQEEKTNPFWSLNEARR